MKTIGKSTATSEQIGWLTYLVAMVLVWPAQAGETASADTTPENQGIAAIRIVDEYGRQVPSGKRYVGSEIFDVTVGPLENEFTFMPDSVTIAVGDTVRWTWESDFHRSPVARPASRMGNFVRLITRTVKPGPLTTQGSCMSSLLRNRVCTSISAPCTALPA